jgi:hypothetical protein
VTEAITKKNWSGLASLGLGILVTLALAYWLYGPGLVATAMTPRWWLDETVQLLSVLAGEGCERRDPPEDLDFRCAECPPCREVILLERLNPAPEKGSRAPQKKKPTARRRAARRDRRSGR